MDVQFIETVKKVLKLIGDKGYSIEELEIIIKNDTIYIENIKIKFNKCYFKFHIIIRNKEIDFTNVYVVKNNDYDVSVMYNKETRKIGKAILELFDYIEENF